MKKVSATEAKTNFERYMTYALSEPVTVSKTGHETIVMLSKQEYDRLQALDDAYWGWRAIEAEKSGYVGVDEGKKLLEKLMNDRFKSV